MARKSSAGKKAPARRKRPELNRSEPLRSWSTLFGGGTPHPGVFGGAAPQTGVFGGTAVGDAGNAGVPSPSDSVQRGVELGYRVIDDYVKQGAAMAGSFAGGVGPGAAAPRDLGQMTERMMQYASDFAALWFDAMGMVMSARNGASPSGAAAPTNGKSAASSAPAETALAIEVRSEQKVKVLLTLNAALAPGARLSVESLRARSGGVLLEDVSVALSERGADQLEIQLGVPKGTPKGRYTGAILDAATQNPRGRLTVTVLD